MKNTALLFSVLIGLTIDLFGQSAIIGTGTSNTNGNIADPTERYYQYERFQIVYTAAELSSAGMQTGDVINALGFSITQSAVSLANYTIDMGLTTQATADPYISTGLTNVRTPFTYTPAIQAAGSFDMISFTSNFAWDGVSNLVVNTCTGPNPFLTPYGGLRYTEAAMGSVRYIRNDGANYCGITTVVNSTYRPNIQFNFTPGNGGCVGTPVPGNTLSTVTTACSGIPFTLSLQNTIPGTGLTYQWQSSVNGLDPWTNIGNSAPQQEISQTAATYYRCMVTCSANTGISTPTLVEMNGSPEFVYVEDTVTGIMCYGATYQIIVAGNESTFTVLSGGEAEMISGVSIFYLPGTKVLSGGYMSGYIDPCGPYCGSSGPPAKDIIQESKPVIINHGGLAIMPNPTSGDFWLEFSKKSTPDKVMVIVSGMNGETILSANIMQGARYKFSLSDFPAGMYFVRVLSGDTMESAKIIKQ